ncbi:MAG TPA: type II toxin-antitoxin system PemK/MazF family toxin [Acidimicrobiia bacterium]|nr:type II toxin-antitoxin system PemK/MazF family toxin [Acidimicrobiia bacterium]
MPSRGDVWYAELDKLRPVVVMHRDFAGRHLRAVLAAPLTTIIRDIPTEVRLGVEHGLDRECVASMDNLTLVDRRRLQTRISRLDDRTMADMCKALSVAVACPLG